MRGWMDSFKLMSLSCLLVTVFAGQAVSLEMRAGDEDLDTETLKKIGATDSAELLRRTDASPEEDYAAGKIVYNRGGMIEAQGIFERAARKGHTKSMIWLAEVLLKADFVAEAADWYRKAAELGSADAQFGLASMMLDHYSYAVGHPDLDYPEARRWLTLAAEQGHVKSIHMMAAAYITGGLGLDAAARSDAEVLKWINLAVQSGNAEVTDVLAGAYRSGKYGLAVDEQKADELANKAKMLRGDDGKKVVVEKKKRRGY